MRVCARVVVRVHECSARARVQYARACVCARVVVCVCVIVACITSCLTVVQHNKTTPPTHIHTHTKGVTVASSTDILGYVRSALLSLSRFDGMILPLNTALGLVHK